MLGPKVIRKCTNCVKQITLLFMPKCATKNNKKTYELCETDKFTIHVIICAPPPLPAPKEKGAGCVFNFFLLHLRQIT